MDDKRVVILNIRCLYKLECIFIIIKNLMKKKMKIKKDG